MNKRTPSLRRALWAELSAQRDFAVAKAKALQHHICDLERLLAELEAAR